VLLGDRTPFDGQRAARTLLWEGPLPTALVIFIDDSAVSAMGLLSEAGIEMPSRLSVFGWDDSVTAARTEGALQHRGRLSRLHVVT